MEANIEIFSALAEALGIGFLIGIERERSEQTLGKNASAGVRTFALASLIGAISVMTGGIPLLIASIVVVSCVRILWVVQQTESSIGLTTSLTLLMVVLLGALATETALLAASIGVVVASLLAARDLLREFSRTILTAAELRDGLILGVSVLVVLPILPNLNYGPGGTLNPRDFFIIVVLVMLIGALGHIATRIAGAKLGLPVSGFLSGFVSSTATIAVLGQRTNDNPGDARSASAGATVSSVSSLIQIGVILLIVSPALFSSGLPVLLAAGLASGLYAAVVFFLTRSEETQQALLELPSQVFSVKSAFSFAIIVATTTLISATLNDYLGNSAIIIIMALAGLASTNSATFALASLVAAGQISATDSALPLIAALSANTLVRIWFALRNENFYFRLTVSGGLLFQLAIFWIIWLLNNAASPA